MTYIPENINRTAINTDAGGRIRSSALTTLFDGKTLDTDNPLLWENVGTGTFNFNLNKMDMSVTSGQYCIRQSHYRCPWS